MRPGVAVEAGAVDVDPHQPPADLERSIAPEIGLAELGADGEDGVGVADRPLNFGPRQEAADEERVARWQQALARGGQQHRRVERLGERPRRLRRVGGTATEDQDRVARRGEQLRRRGDRRRLRRRARRRRRELDEGAGVGGDDVERQLDMDRARPPAGEECGGRGEGLRQRLGIKDRPAPGRNAVDERALILQLVEPPLPAPEVAAGKRARQDEHRHRVRIGLAHRSGDVREARPGDHEAGGRPAAGAGMAVGHEAGALLVARRDVPEPAVRQTAIELDGVDAGNAEDAADADRLEIVRQDFSDGRHCGLPRLPLSLQARPLPASVSARRSQRGGGAGRLPRSKLTDFTIAKTGSARGEAERRHRGPRHPRDKAVAAAFDRDQRVGAAARRHRRRRCRRGR